MCKKSTPWHGRRLRVAAGKLQSASVANNVPPGHIHRRLRWWPQQRRQCNAVICSCLSLCLCAFKMCNIWDGIKILTLIDWRPRLGINAGAGLRIRGAAGRERHSSTSDGIHSLLAAVWQTQNPLGNRSEMLTHFHTVSCQNQYSARKIFHMIEWKRSWTNNSIFFFFFAIYPSATPWMNVFPFCYSIKSNVAKCVCLQCSGLFLIHHFPLSTPQNDRGMTWCVTLRNILMLVAQ